MLQVKNLNFGYKFRPILRGVGFELKPGELLHITGPNGCGKTTLMSILAGLIRETGGTITYVHEGQACKDRRSYIEYLPAEANGLYGKMDAMDNLRFWMSLRGHPTQDQTIVDELKMWSLDHPLIRKNFPVEKFSTGMKRRLSLARVHLSNTPVWLLDEPLYGLDIKGIEQFQAILREHLDRGGSAAVVSHDTAPLQPFNPTEYRIEKREVKG
ncbi:heme ABC exporter ATP-binding protein CcmA [Pseudobacteriovorax antillogorgiicola]|uniref:Heme exporter protein A n=1 Tax=Pseudobacteriovorax antillogorgiicola TaxID=1513793 RepID=A0A1Y6C052_9BACT|nr:heme ABC exporter ATP-binding protein CcmA [Pseudobacteriovorax antillogorgiicola]TCS52348.1 heme exporter protein A [Pseudobacteriovorax antillogorgiicola]SMF29637.1 heme exporter protein A [Pseudobacteriovorax antillogorgiicola]